MERIIKFRGIRCSLRYEGQDRWVYGNYVESSRSWHGCRPHKSWILPSPYTNGGWFSTAGAIAVKDETVGQFTGLYDKNGKEIYEGDVIGNSDINHLIRYNSKRAQFTATLTEYVGDLMERSWECMCEQSWIDEFGKEIIGNIHDNPELLKGGEK